MFIYKIIIKAKAKAFAVYDIPYTFAKVLSGLFQIPIIRISIPLLQGIQVLPPSRGNPLINLKSFTGIFFQNKTGNHAVFYPVIFWNLFKK